MEGKTVLFHAFARVQYRTWELGFCCPSFLTFALSPLPELAGPKKKKKKGGGEDRKMAQPSNPLLQGQPSNEDIVSLCLNANNPGGFKYTSPHHGWTVWIQHGPHITISTARTQLYAHRHADPDLMHVPWIYHSFEHEGVGYILMEYIPRAVTLAEYMQSSSRPDETYALVADSVRHMTRFTVPKNAAPGPVGGGSLRFGGFPVGWGREWKDVWELQECVNEVLRQEEKTPSSNKTKGPSEPWRVDFTHPSSSTSLMFCYTDLCPDNFLISTDEALSGKSRLHIVDFNQAGFLPRAFLELVLCQSVCAMPIYLMVFPEGAAAVGGRRNLRGLQRAAYLLKMKDSDARKPKGREVRISRFCRGRWHPQSLIVARESVEV